MKFISDLRIDWRFSSAAGKSWGNRDSSKKWPAGMAKISQIEEGMTEGYWILDTGCWVMRFRLETTDAALNY
ncbi:MAG: hypothetical protein QF473_02955 [Planctomycetota bacterium]|jgi:hypothetical protein|nr:hypothetical protein [Planctomycetota bacterium]